jgi:hypothetical protein
VSTRQYCLFAGHHHYPEGGASDFRAMGSIDELKAMYAVKGKAWSAKVGSYPDPWGEIADHETMKVVLRTDPYKPTEWRDAQ